MNGGQNNERISTKLVIGLTILAILIGSCGLPFSCFIADDLIQLGILEKVSPNTWTGPLGLYTISDGLPEHVGIMKNAGAFPWFFDPGFKMAFFRPFSSALLYLDHSLFGLKPLGYGIHNVLWYLLLVVGVGWLIRETLPVQTGKLALVIFVISGIHGILFWTATRHIAIAASLGILALASHIRWREKGWKPGQYIALIGIASALAASEAAVGVFGYFVAYEMLGAPGDRQSRLLASLPLLALLVLYLTLYAGFHFGTAGGSGYLDPFHDPVHFVIELPGRLAVLIGAIFAGGSADLWVLRPDYRQGMIVAGILAVFLLVALFRGAWTEASMVERNAVRWLAAGAVLSAIPFTGTPLGVRCVIVPFVGGAAVIAFILHGWWTVFRKRSGLRYRSLGALCVVLAGIHLGLAPVQRLAYPVLLHGMMYERLDSAMRSAELNVEGIEQRTVVLLMAPDIAIGLHSYFYRTLHRLPMPASWRALSWAPCDHRFTRTGVDMLEMTLVDGEIDAPSVRAGDVIDLSDMRVEVLDVGSRGPVRVEFRFNRSLDHPSFLFLAWRDGRLRAVPPPCIGESILLSRTRVSSNAQGRSFGDRERYVAARLGGIAGHPTAGSVEASEPCELAGLDLQF